jgi:hypothetical protein
MQINSRQGDLRSVRFDAGARPRTSNLSLHDKIRSDAAKAILDRTRLRPAAHRAVSARQTSAQTASPSLGERSTQRAIFYEASRWRTLRTVAACRWPCACVGMPRPCESAAVPCERVFCVPSEGGTMSTKKRWRKPPPAPPRPEDRFWRRAPGGLLGWSGRVLRPDQQMRERKPDDESTSRVLRMFPSEPSWRQARMKNAPRRRDNHCDGAAGGSAKMSD